jgi:hypothetical protein
MSRIIRSVALVLAVTALASAQRRLHHYDDTTEWTSRGNFGVLPGTALQRIPWDQAAGATALTEVVARIQDQDPLTPEAVTFELRSNDPFAPLGAPDMLPGGLLGVLGPFVVLFPGVGPTAFEFTFVGPAPGFPLPFGIGPAGDWYLGLSFGPAPAWPADGISAHISAAIVGTAGEQMNPAAVGYTGAVGLAGLGWTFNAATGVLALGTGNRAWYMAGRYDKDVLQPYASNPAAFTASGPLPAGTGDGANPNAGYAGIFPMGARPVGADAIGLRLRTLAPVGTPTALIVGTMLFPAPIFFPLGSGIDPASAGLYLDPSAPDTLILDLPLGVVTVPAPATEPAFVSDAWWGPFALPPFFAGLTIYAQGVALTGFGPSFFTISTMCRFTI